MSEDLLELARRYRDILRQAVYLVRAMDADGELSTRQVSTLSMVADAPTRVSDIARFSGIRVPSATEQVIKLEAAGLVQRAADDSDARVVLVTLTATGRTKLDEANERRNSAMAQALTTLSEAEQRAIGEALPAIAKLNTALTSS
ncbi:ArsR family transcriptional regulator [Arthrobacter sp. ERGS1:01]|uniref:MarR family winged helix-turn-helix transcriptional regulator n=1 Tax=Arthrobacter sp. ERGS1:01 TaxID=1704044 RepID=UPI0006B59549|nr:MarR family transcriptional regulator [Arthrobacter sp. ERGS1:01]ALE07112.1 ArsR family transcriptional regulator [Arthrobacter sp. ERGS1:01]